MNQLNFAAGVIAYCGRMKKRHLTHFYGVLNVQSVIVVMVLKMQINDFNGKHRRSKLKIYQYLEEVGEASTQEIYFHLNSLRNSTQTMNTLGNILHRTKYFKKLRFIDECDIGDRRRGLIWGLNNES